VATPVVALLAVVALAACEQVIVNRTNQVRVAAGASNLPVSDVLTDAARDHSRAMCSAGATTPSPDPAATYDQETAGAIHELVGSAPLDPGTADPVQRNVAATNDIWARWKDDPVLTDGRWDAIGVGEVECASDSRLYVTTVLRDAPSMPTTGRFSSIQYTQAQIQTVSGLQYGTAIDYRGVAVPLQLDLYLPPDHGAPRPLVVLVHGGGFYTGTRASMQTAAIGYARRGYAAASISYRLDPRVQAQPELLLGAAADGIDDGMESIRWLRTNATTYGVDATRIAGIGTSAGGAVVLGIALTDDPTPGGPLGSVSPTIAAAISTGASLTPGIETGGVTFEASDAPVLMFHHELDTSTGSTDEEAFETCEGVRTAGSTCDFRVQAGSGHTVTISAGGTYWAPDIGPFLWHQLDL
jgi:predicted esterase